MCVWFFYSLRIFEFAACSVFDLYCPFVCFCVFFIQLHCGVALRISSDYLHPSIILAETG